MSPIGNRIGFTLVELLVALVIMTLLSGVVMVSIWPAMNEARLRTGARTVIAACRYARGYAVTHQVETAVQFDRERHGVSVLTQEITEQGEEVWRSVTTPAGRFKTLPDGIAVADVMRDGAEQDDSEAMVIFSAVGQSEDAQITLRDTSDREGDTSARERMIRIDGITGRCALIDNP